MTVHHVTVDQFAKILGRLDSKIERAIVRGLQSAAMRLQGLVVNEIDSAEPFPAVDRGELRNSTKFDRLPLGAILSMTAPHAGIIEYGTRPFFPPIEPLARWALRKGLADDEEEAEEIAWSIARHISQMGIEPRGYFIKAVMSLKHDGILREEIKRELDALARSGP